MSQRGCFHGRIPVEGQVEWLLDLDRALDRLREHDEGLARAFECRFFAGLSEEETAEALGVPSAPPSASG